MYDARFAIVVVFSACYFVFFAWQDSYSGGAGLFLGLGGMPHSRSRQGRWRQQERSLQYWHGNQGRGVRADALGDDSGGNDDRDGDVGDV